MLWLQLMRNTTCAIKTIISANTRIFKSHCVDQMRTARKRTETATNASKKPKKRKEPDEDGRADRDEASKPKKKTVSRKSKKVNQWEALAHSLEAIHRVVLVDEAVSKLKLRFSEQSLGNLVNHCAPMTI